MFPANNKSSKYRGLNPGGRRACGRFLRFGMAVSIVLCACGKTDSGDFVNSQELHGQAVIAGGLLYGMSDEGLISVPLDGGQPGIVVIAGGSDVPFGTFVLSPDEVFFTGSASAFADFTISAVSRQRGATSEIATLEGESPGRLFGNAANLYWSSTRGRGTVGGTTAVLQTMPSVGGDVVTLLSEPDRDYAVAGVDSSRIYFFALPADQGISSLNAIAIDGSGPVVHLASGQLDQCCFTLVGGTVIWQSGSTLRSTDVTTGITTDRSNLGNGDGLIADARGGFIASSFCQEPTEVHDATCSYSLRDIDTGRVVASATSSASVAPAHGMALEDTWVYWTVSGQGLYRVRR